MSSKEHDRKHTWQNYVMVSNNLKLELHFESIKTYLPYVGINILLNLDVILQYIIHKTTRR